jgi:uncharacterized protein YacL
VFLKLLRVVIIVVGFMAGPGVVSLLDAAYGYFTGVPLSSVLESWFLFVLYVASGIISGIIFIFLSKKITMAIHRGMKGIENWLQGAPSITIFSGAVGLIIGLIIAALISNIIALIPVAFVSIPLTIVDYLIFGYLGLATGVRRRQDFANMVAGRKQQNKDEEPAGAMAKLLDTSVIIDGRIYDVCKTGVLEGELLVAEFVLKELQNIADSEDSMRRTRGRRGLDVLKKMQRELKNPVRVIERDYDDIQEVDIKLLRLAKDIGAVLVTNDYNLNKVAAVQNVKVFNINELANAVKPILMAGEELVVAIVKDGKEHNQGIAYLDDGTMIVVEGAKGMAERTLDVIVTSILQTAAGRMIFAKIK